MTRPTALAIQVRIGAANGQVLTVRGREAWALRMLMGSGERGCTPIDHPGPRWSGYVHDLRKLGIVIDTIHERHLGNFPGTHARYVLRSRVEVVDQTERMAEIPANPSAIVRRMGDGQRPSHYRKNRTGSAP